MVGLRLLVIVLGVREVFGSVISESVNFFRIKKLPFVTGYFCDDSDKIQLAKELASKGIRSNFPNPEKIQTVHDLNKGLYHPSSQMTGVLLHLNCKNSEKILKIASENRFFDISRHWLIVTDVSFTQNEFEAIAQDNEPNMFNIKDYLAHDTDTMRVGERIKELNKEMNGQVLQDANVIALLKNKTRQIYPKNSKEQLISFLVDLKPLVDSEVTLAVATNSSFTFYEIHKKTQFTKMVIEKINVGDWNGMSAIHGRRNFNGTLVRATLALLYYDYISRTDDLTSEIVDIWAMKGIQMTVMAEEKFNYRMIIKVVDDYGWAANGKFTGMVKHLAEQRSDMTVGGLLLVDVRMDGITYIASSYKVRLDLFFKQPTLSQVANIFILPFETTVWVSVISLLFVTAAILILQFRLVEKLEQALTVRFLEIFTFLTGAACQQGTDLVTHVISARVTMVVFLIASLFLFVSYSANIVSLLQSSSNAINSIRTFLDSSIEMGMENLPYQAKLIEGDSDPLIRELFQKKLLEKKLRGTAYLNATAGMQKMRRELYAFHMETENGARIMGETFSESEKCFVKTITLFPNRFNGHAVPKQSPFFEMLKYFVIWYEERGFLQRNEARFGYKLPKCSGKGSGGFNSIGLSDIRSIVLMLQCGFAVSFALMLVENIYHWIRKRKLKTVGKPQNGQFFSDDLKKRTKKWPTLRKMMENYD